MYVSFSEHLQVSCAECHKTCNKEAMEVREFCNSVLLPVSYHSRPSCSIQICPNTHQTLRVTLLDPYTRKVNETISGQNIKLMLVVSFTTPVISNYPPYSTSQDFEQAIPAPASASEKELAAYSVTSADLVQWEAKRLNAILHGRPVASRPRNTSPASYKERPLQY